MGNIDKVTQGSLAKNKKLNEVIGAINSIAKMSVRQAAAGESPRFVFAENKCELIVPACNCQTPGSGG
jgi:hypothetical protein